MTQPTDRPGIDHITTDLDWTREQLLAAQRETTEAVTRLERTEAERDMLGREGDRLRKDWVEMRTRAERAEATLTAVRAELTAIEQTHGGLDCECEAEASAGAVLRIRAVLDKHDQTPA